MSEPNDAAIESVIEVLGPDVGAHAGIYMIKVQILSVMMFG